MLSSPAAIHLADVAATTDTATANGHQLAGWRQAGDMLVAICERCGQPAYINSQQAWGDTLTRPCVTPDTP